MPTNDIILISDYNTVQDKIAQIIGVGYGDRGYGQLVNSAAVSTIAPKPINTAALWDDLRYDLSNIKLHQDGFQPNIVDPATGQVIRYGPEYSTTQYDDVITAAIGSRFDIGAGRSVIAAAASSIFSDPWSEYVRCTATVQFDTADEARYFFNSSGTIRFYSSRTGGSATQSNTSWTALLNSSGTVSFGAVTDPPVTFYGLTNTYQQIFRSVESGIYAYEGRHYQISAKCNIPSNIVGGATSIDFLIEWINDIPSGVDGNLLIQIDELKASGPILPSGTFTITSPTYTISPYTSV